LGKILQKNGNERRIFPFLWRIIVVKRGDDVMDKKQCPKCDNEMMEGTARGNFSGIRNDGVYDGTETTKYMCKECGYIEEWADDPKFIESTRP